MLLRRVSYDLTGLPPAPADVQAILANSDPQALTKITEQMLGSRAYGEHWARHWMDVARYADSAGYELDYMFTDAWKYRDWLIRSFESNKPLDRFIEEQIAGDQLWPASVDAADGIASFSPSARAAMKAGFSAPANANTNGSPI